MSASPAYRHSVAGHPVEQTTDQATGQATGQAVRPLADHAAPLRFGSSTTSPLAWMAGAAINVGRFRADVQRFSTALQHTATGDTLLSCSGRYAFGVALLASWLSGRTAVLPPNPMPQTLSDIRQCVAIGFDCDDRWAQQFANPDERAHADHDQHGQWQPTLAIAAGPAAEPAAEQAAVRLFTSGSSGAPKQVDKSLGNLLAEANTLADHFNWPAGAILAGVRPQHLYGLTFSVLLPWVLGRPWVDDMPRYPRDVLAAIARNHVGTLISVPAHYQALLQHEADANPDTSPNNNPDTNPDTNPDNKAATLRCVSAAAPLDKQLADDWQQCHGDDILEIYGSTETGVVAWRKQRRATSWQALPSVQLARHQGLLKVTSPFVSASCTDGDDGYITADRISTPHQGRFELLGRTDAIIKIAGKRVSLSRIEEQIRACDGVSDAAVIAVPAQGVVRDLAIWAAVVGDPGQPLPAAKLRAQLRAQLRDRLDGIEIPRRVLVVDILPRNPSGKLTSQAITALFSDHDQRQADVQLPV